MPAAAQNPTCSRRMTFASPAIPSSTKNVAGPSDSPFSQPTLGTVTLRSSTLSGCQKKAKYAKSGSAAQMAAAISPTLRLPVAACPSRSTSTTDSPPSRKPLMNTSGAVISMYCAGFSR